MQALANYILRGRMQAMLIALVCSLVPFLSWFGLVVTALVTLRKSPQEGAYVLIATILPSFVLIGAGWASYTLLYYLLFSNLTVWLAAIVLYRTNSWANVLQAIMLLGVFAVVAIHMAYPDIAATWAQIFNKAFTDLKVQNLIINVEPTQLQQVVNFAIKIATGIQVGFILLNSLFNVLLARWWQAALYNPGGLRPEILALRLDKVAAIVLVLVTGLAVVGSSLALDILPVILLPFFLAGLALAHTVAISVKQKWLCLFGLYGALIFLFPQLFLLLALLAWLDIWFNFRGRMVLTKK